MLAFIIRRILMVIPTLLGVTVIVFLMLRITPGDPAELLLGERATPEALDAMREYLGLKEPLYVQYGMFIKRALQLDLGETIFTREKVSREIGQKFPATIELAVVAMFISCFFGIILGIISATKQYSWFDYTAMVTSLFGVSMPVFWLGLMLMLLFSLNLGWFPMSGRIDVETDIQVITNFFVLDAVLARDWAALGDALMHLALPATALSTIPLAIVSRMTRSSMLEVLRQDYIKTAKAKGLSQPKIVLFKKWPYPGGDRHRASVRNPHGRRHSHGNRVCLAGGWEMAFRRGGETGLHGDSGRDPAGGHHLCDRESYCRRALRRDQSKNQCEVSYD